MIIASESGHDDIVKYLIDKGADLNIKDGEGYTALLKAVLNGYTEIEKALDQFGASWEGVELIYC